MIDESDLRYLSSLRERLNEPEKHGLDNDHAFLLRMISALEAALRNEAIRRENTRSILDLRTAKEAVMATVRRLRDHPELDALLKRARAAYDAMTPEQKTAHDAAQRESFVRANLEIDRAERAERMTRRIAPRKEDVC